MQIEHTEEERIFVLDILNGIIAQNVEAIRRMQALAAKLEGAKDGGQEAAVKQGTEAPVQEGKGRKGKGVK